GTDTVDTTGTDTTGTDTTGTDTTGNDTSTSTTGNDPIPCDIAEADLAPVVPNVMLVLDKSGSMLTLWDHDADPNTAQITRWHSLHNVVEFMLNNFADLFELGAQLYPSTNATNQYNINACLVNDPPEVAVAPNNAIAVLLGIPVAGSQNIRGGTPTSAGMSSAIDHLVGLNDSDPSAIILVTDGAANCRTDAPTEFDRFEVYDPNLLPMVTDAYDNLGIATYVIGIDISNELTMVVLDGEPDAINPTVQLNEVAIAGGKPKGGDEDFYQAQNEIELMEAMQAIIDDAASCKVLLDPIPAFPNLLEVVVDNVVVPKVMDCDNEDGWMYSADDFSELTLCGSWCAMSQDAEVVKAEYYCDPG
ncbi:MAG: VWA domain-containing protein, partial [Myxococcales bacterium]|nr:VWA domain-containing protein [Myxococcales bacterium]